MGNIGAESSFVPNIVEGRCPLSNFDYTHNVDIGTTSKYDFCHDSYGYGLCQWTLPYRKEKLYEFARLNGDSIGNEEMQVHFILKELTTEGEYAALYKYLCETTDLYEATKRICVQYERPAVNNIDARYQIACRCANEAYDDMEAEPVDPPESQDGCGDDSCPIEFDGETCDITVRVLRQGMIGRDVFVAQTAINDIGRDCGVPDGDFGPNTESGVRDLQETCGLPVTGVIGQAEWQIIFQ